MQAELFEIEAKHDHYMPASNVEEINPYYKMWMEAAGGGELYEFIVWINRKHSEYKKIDCNSNGYHERFSAWLEAQCVF